MANDFSLNPLTGKGSNAWVLNWIYMKILITSHINLAFFFSFAKTSRLYTLLPSVPATFFAVYAFTVWQCLYYNSGLNQTVNIRIHYSILNYVFDITKTESIHCTWIANLTGLPWLFYFQGEAQATITPCHQPLHDSRSLWLMGCWWHRILGSLSP